MLLLPLLGSVATNTNQPEFPIEIPSFRIVCFSCRGHNEIAVRSALATSGSLFLDTVALWASKGSQTYGRLCEIIQSREPIVTVICRALSSFRLLSCLDQGNRRMASRNSRSS
jgi:hypothetical protein